MSPQSRRGGRFPGLLLAFMLILSSGLPLARLDAAAEERPGPRPLRGLPVAARLDRSRGRPSKAGATFEAWRSVTL